MRAIRFHEHGDDSVLRIETVDRPTPAGRDVLVDVEAFGINHVDGLFREGIFTPPALPAIPGSDFAGTVAAVGTDVTEFAVGDRVCGAGLGGDRPGSYAEYVTAPVERVAPLPDGVDAATAAAMGHVGVAAWQAVIHHGNLAPASVCLIHGGAGGLGHIAVQLAARAGATVVTTAADQDDRDRLEALGAAETFDYRREDLAETVEAVGRPDLIVDYHFDQYAQLDVELLAHGGRVAVLEFTPETGGRATIDQSTFRVGVLKDARIQLVGIFNGDIATVLSRLAALVARGDLEVVIADRYSFEEAPQAQHDIVEQSHFGTLVVEV